MIQTRCLLLWWVSPLARDLFFDLFLACGGWVWRDGVHGGPEQGKRREGSAHTSMFISLFLACGVGAGRPEAKGRKEKGLQSLTWFHHVISLRFFFFSSLLFFSFSIFLPLTHPPYCALCVCVCVCVYLRLHSSFFLVSSHPPSLPPSLPLLSFMPASFQEEGREGRREGGREGACGVAPRGLSVRCLSGFRSAGGGKERGREGRWDGRGK